MQNEQQAARSSNPALLLEIELSGGAVQLIMEFLRVWFLTVAA